LPDVRQCCLGVSAAKHAGHARRIHRPFLLSLHLAGRVVLRVVSAYNRCMQVLVARYWYDFGVTDRGGREWPWLRGCLFWRLYHEYFPITLHKTAELPADRNYIFALAVFPRIHSSQSCFPHGIFCNGAHGNISCPAIQFNKLFPGIKPRMLTLNINFLVFKFSHLTFQIPFRREITMALGFCNASKESIRYMLTKQPGKGHAVGLMIGGAEESLHAKPGSYVVVLKRRFGFVREALVNGFNAIAVL